MFEGRTLRVWRRDDITIILQVREFSMNRCIRRYLIVHIFVLLSNGFDERASTLAGKRLGSFFKCELPSFEHFHDDSISPDGDLYESTSNVKNLAINFHRWRRLIGGLISGSIVRATTMTSRQNISQNCEWWKSSDYWSLSACRNAFEGA